MPHEDDHWLEQRPVLLFYCQHSLGIGHLTRSFALVRALMGAFKVVFLNGGRMPEGLVAPAGMVRIDMPALGMDDGHTVVSRDDTHDVGQARRQRRLMIEEAVRHHRPALLLVEMFPFGRKKFTAEILAMIRLARRVSDRQVRVACSLRDILVDARPDQQHHDDRACWLANRYFDQVLVHADPALARLEESFRPTRVLQVPIAYTGYVVPVRNAGQVAGRGPHLLVSAGGGIVGDALFRLALQARALLADPPPMRIVAGPFLPEAQWLALRRSVEGLAGVELLRQVPDMVKEMRVARASLSQCGYNTALDIAVSGVPALVVPYATVTENEQGQRSARLAAIGALRSVPAQGLDAAKLAEEITRLLAFEPAANALDLDGAAMTARRLTALLAGARHSSTTGALA